jgi:hypothetical protein
VISVRRVDELGGDPKPVPRAADASLQYRGDVELLPDLADVEVAALVGEGRRP